MWKIACLLLVFLCLVEVQGFHNRQTSYDGYVVYRVTAHDENDARAISRLKKVKGIDFWSNIDLQNHRVDIMVAPRRKEEFLRFLIANNLEWIVIIEDVGEIIDLLSALPGRARSMDGHSDVATRNISQYLSYKQIVNYAESLVNVTNPENGKNLVELEIAGKSSAGEEVIMMKISSDHQKKKPIIFLEAALHAREWAGPPTVLYLAQQLVENYAENKDMLENVDFYIIPVSNPDGYEYSRKEDRMWRKTRSNQGACIGTDANRNFDYFWGFSGTSSDTCSDIYRGPKPFSELESQNIRNVGLKYLKRLLGYVAVHTYGGYLLYPWGYARELPQDWDRLDECATSFTNAVKKYSGTEYTQGSSAQVLYEAAGGSDDYMKGKLNVPFAYTLELAAPDEEGFHLNPKKLPAVGQETFQGFKALADCFWIFHAYDKTSETIRAKSVSKHLHVFSPGGIQGIKQ